MYELSGLKLLAAEACEDGKALFRELTWQACGADLAPTPDDRTVDRQIAGRTWRVQDDGVFPAWLDLAERGSAS